MWAATEIDDASDETGEPETEVVPKNKKRRVEKVKRRKFREHGDEEDAPSSSDELVGQGKKKDTSGKRKRREDDSAESNAEREAKGHKKRRIAETLNGEDGKPLRMSSKSRSPIPESGSSSGTDEASSPRRSPVHSKSRSKSRKLKDTSPDTLGKTFPSSAHIYRAIRQERVTMGWSQAPCALCRTFSFCRDGGPVGPKECEYYSEWLT